jgi:hypothetical protein
MNDLSLMITIPAIVIVIALLILIFQWLWNITMPDVFGLKEVTYWQSFRLLLIAGFLFGGASAAASSG